MKRFELSIPQLGLIAGTRGMLGAGVALLVADKLPREQRRAIGWTLAIVGALTTIPLAMQLLGSRHKHNGRALSASPPDRGASKSE